MGPDPRPVTRLDRTRRVVRVGDSDDPNERRRRFRPCVRASVRACVGAIDRGSALRRSFVRVVRPSASFASFVRIVRAGRSIDRPIGRSPWGPSSSSSRFPRGRRRAGADANGARRRRERTRVGGRDGGSTRKREPDRRPASGVSTALKKKTERAHGRGCAHPSSRSFVRSFVSGRESGREKKKRSTHLRGDRAADGLLRRRRALGEREEAGVQSEGNHDYLRSCVDRSAGRSRDARLGTDAIIGVVGRWNFQLALHYGTLSISRKNVKNVRRPERPRVKSLLIRTRDRSFQRSKSDGGV